MTRLLKGRKEFVRFVLGVALLIILPVLVVSITGLHRSRVQMKERNLEYWQMIVRDIVYDLDVKIKEYDNLSMTALLQEDMLDILSRKEFDQVEYMEACSWLEHQLTVELFLNQSIVSSFQVLGNNGFYYTSDSSVSREEAGALAERVEKSGKISILTSAADAEVEEGFVTIGRYIYSYKDLQPLGYFLMSLRSRELDSIWANKELSNIRMLVFDGKGTVVYGELDNDWEARCLYSALAQEKGAFQGPKAAGENLYVYEKSDYTGQTAVAAVSREVYNSSAWNFARTFLIGGAVAVLTASMLAYFLVKRVYDVALANEKNATERSKAEMKALQTQINPHFLYNTLGAVNMYSIMEDAEAVQNITDALSKMFRYAVQNPLVPVKITEEIDHVKNYLKIQEYRMGRMPRLEVDVREAGEAYMLRLSLQPIVENIFKHAFSGGIREEHYIRIHAFHREDKLYVDVEDNGKGPSMNVEHMEYVTDGEQNGRGIGLSNVHRRLKLAYGEKAGLWICGKPGRGMTIQLCQPWLIQEENGVEG